MGFVIGTKSITHLFKIALRERFIFLALDVMLRLISTPRLLRNVVHTVAYSSKETGPDAELVVIAVDSTWRGQGIGRKLVEGFEREFRHHGIDAYKVSAQSDQRSVRF